MFFISFIEYYIIYNLILLSGYFQFIQTYFDIYYTLLSVY